jgi:hypothetical protein
MVSKHAAPAPPSRSTSSESETASVHPVRLSQPAPPTSADTATTPNYRTVAFTASFTAEETVFVVMRDQQINSAGDKVVRFNVYRLTVFYPEIYPSNPHKTLSKSI